MYEWLIDKCYQALLPYTEEDALSRKKLKYMLYVVIGESLKILLILAFFTVLGWQKPFFIGLLSLLFVRSFHGGLHFKGFGICLLASWLFFFISLLSWQNISLTNHRLGLIFLITILIPLLTGIVPSSARPPIPSSKKTVFLAAGLLVIVIHYLIYSMGSRTYTEISVWVLFYQSIQLLIGKGVDYYEKKSNACTDSHSM